MCNLKIDESTYKIKTDHRHRNQAYVSKEKGKVG